MKFMDARDKNRPRVRGGGVRGSFGGDIYGTGERNPWEFSSLAFESNSSSRKRQTFSLEAVVRNTSGR